MKEAYPILISPAEGGFVVYIPDFNINTEGDTLTLECYSNEDCILWLTPVAEIYG